jgi:hypothetical protein
MDISSIATSALGNNMAGVYIFFSRDNCYRGYLVPY